MQLTGSPELVSLGALGFKAVSCVYVLSWSLVYSSGEQAGGTASTGMESSKLSRFPYLLIASWLLSKLKKLMGVGLRASGMELVYTPPNCRRSPAVAPGNNHVF